MSQAMNRFLLLLLAGLLTGGCSSTRQASSGSDRGLRDALTFYASFDTGMVAEVAKGDPKMYHAASMAKAEESTQEGLPPGGEVTGLQAQGVFGHALRFNKKKSPLVFFQAARNLDYQLQDWSGSVSFWLSLDPQKDLEPGFTDPIQITPRAWNDAAFFVEFGKDENPRHFRLGAYADFAVWNPENRKWEEVREKPLIGVERPPFAHGKWTHVVFTWEKFNTGQSNGVARLYLDGKLQGSMIRKQTFTWDPRKTKIMLGLSYIGLFDELAIFNRSLSEEEIERLGSRSSNWFKESENKTANRRQ